MSSLIEASDLRATVIGCLYCLGMFGPFCLIARCGDNKLEALGTFPVVLGRMDDDDDDESPLDVGRMTVEDDEDCNNARSRGIDVGGGR